MAALVNVIETCWGDVGLTLSMPYQGLGNSAIAAVATDYVPTAVMYIFYGLFVLYGLSPLAVVANGGRVLNATGRGATLAEARARAYALAEAVDWPQGFMRRDIGWRAL